MPLNLGNDAQSLPPPRWEQFLPAQPGAVGKAFGGRARYEQRRLAAERDFERAMEEHGQAESVRQRRVADARARHSAALTDTRERAAEQHAEVDDFRRRVLEGDRRAVSDYY